jgi:hypothetical protein
MFETAIRRYRLDEDPLAMFIISGVDAYEALIVMAAQFENHDLVPSRVYFAGVVGINRRWSAK